MLESLFIKKKCVICRNIYLKNNCEWLLLGSAHPRTSGIRTITNSWRTPNYTIKDGTNKKNERYKSKNQRIINNIKSLQMQPQNFQKVQIKFSYLEITISNIQEYGLHGRSFLSAKLKYMKEKPRQTLTLRKQKTNLAIWFSTWERIILPQEMIQKELQNLW